MCRLTSITAEGALRCFRQGRQQISEVLDQCYKKIEGLRKRDGLIIGTGVTALGAALTAVGVFARLRPEYYTASALLTWGMAKFFGGKDGALKVFTDYLPKVFQLNRSLCKPAPHAGPTGIWEGTGIRVRWSQFFDERLAAAIGDRLIQDGIKTAYDFGCGLEDPYSKVLAKAGIECSGVDGNPGAGTIHCDLAQPVSMPKRDCVISLEVGAKIPKAHEQTFIDNVCTSATKMIILSWPVPGQAGPNQFNRQPNEYITKKFREKGWDLDLPATTALRKRSHPIYYWFQDTLMVFKPQGFAQSGPQEVKAGEVKCATQ